MRAILRGVPSSFVDALTTVSLDAPIDVPLARAQHDVYRSVLASLGVDVTLLSPDEACPDSCFVEDTAIVANGVALVTRPGAPSRRAEVEPVAAALALWLDVERMQAPATLDGGDCMRLGDILYVGRSQRTNAAGIARLAEVFAPRGLGVVAVDLPEGVLHLKCVCSPLDEGRVLLAEHSVPASTFRDVAVVWAPERETYAANAVAVGPHVIVAEGYPGTRDALVRAGMTVQTVPVSEARKADGSLTCQSILVPG